MTLMTRSETLTWDDLHAVETQMRQTQPNTEIAPETAEHARVRVNEDIESARASGVRFTPTFFINGRRFDGPWDDGSFIDAMLGSLGHRVRTAALSFASRAPSTGVLLLLTTILAIVLSNSWMAPYFAALWQTSPGLTFGSASFNMSLLHWVNDALLTLFLSSSGWKSNANSRSVIWPAVALPLCLSPQRSAAW